MRIAAAAGCLAVAVALVLSGCSAGDDAKSIITANGSEPLNRLIPGDTVELGGARILESMFAGLVFYGADGTPVNDLAESIEGNKDMTVFTVRVRQDQTFTNGETVDAESFMAAWDWAADSSNEALNQSYFSDILGYKADDPKTGDVERSSLIETGGLVLVNDYTFEIHLKASLSDFPQRLGLLVYDPLPDVFFDDVDAFAQNPVGNGPYMLDGDGAWQHDERIDLIVNPDYDGPREPENNGVSLVFYDTLDTAYVDLLGGRLDVLDEIPASALTHYKEELGKRAIDQPGAVLQSITIPARLPHFAGKEGQLRRAAISMAIDRDRITQEIFGGTRLTAHDFTSPVVEGYSENTPGSEVLIFDSDEAKDLWADAEKISPWEGTFEIAYNADGGHQAWVDAVARSIQKVLGIEVAGAPYPTFADVSSVIADRSIASAFRVDRHATYPGLQPFLAPTYGTKAPSNFGDFASPAYDGLLKSAAAADTTADADKFLQQAQQVLFTELPSIPLWYSTERAGYGEGVDDVVVNWNAVPEYFQITKSG